jgi:hypothetical protein
MTFARIAIFSFFGLASFATAEPRWEQKLADDGLQVELTRDGLSAVAMLAQSQLLGEGQELEIADIDKSLLGIGLHLRGLKVAFKAESIDLVPIDGALDLEVGLRGITLSIDSFQVERRILGAQLQKTCYDTDFFIAEQGTVYFQSKLGATVDNRQISLSERDTSFRVSADNYRVRGPGSCDGRLTGPVTRLLLHTVLKAARPAIETLVKRQIRELLPTLATELTAQSNLSLSLDLANFPPLPPRVVTLAAYPHRLTITPGGLSIVVGASITGEDTPRFARVEQPRAGARRFGSLGVNPALLTEAITAAFPDGTPWIEVDASMLPDLKGLLELDSLKVLWPDLQNVPTEEPFARLKARVVSAPELGSDAATNALTASLPQVELMFLVKTGGEWRDYSLLKLDIKTGVTPTLADGKLSISLLPGSTIGVEGAWVDGYEPTNTYFDQETAEFLMTTLIDVAMRRGALVSVELPQVDVLGQPLAIGSVGVQAPFISIGIYDAAP